MEKSTANNLALSDVVNTFIHMLFVIIAATIPTLLVSLNAHAAIDWSEIGSGALISILTGIQVLIRRYLNDNTNGN